MESSPSIQNLLISIPSQASSLAATAMGHLIEDQMYDTEVMKKNLKRIGSVASEWCLGYRTDQELGPAGDMGFLYKKKSFCKIPLLMLPEQVRHKIWSRLGNKDILALRAVCSQMQNEMDHVYGLPTVLNTENESVLFMHHATSRSCFVTKLDNLLYFNFFAEPEKLKQLRLQHDVPLVAETLDLVFRKFPNLDTVSFWNTNPVCENQEGKMQLIVPTDTKILLNMISDMETIYGVELKYNSPTAAIEWKLELHESQKSKVNVGYVHLDMPGEASHHQRDALTFLDEQNHLFEIRSQLVGLSWSWYTGVIHQNSGSLIGLHLLSLKCSMDEPFDCGCLIGCQKLKFLSISGENSFVNTNIGGFAFIPIVNVKTLATLKNLATISFENVQLSENELTALKDNLYKVWIHISQSMIEKKEVSDLKLGFKAYSGYNDGLYDNQDEEGFDDYFDTGRHDKAQDNQHIIKSFLCDNQSALIKGLIITAWLTFC